MIPYDKLQKLIYQRLLLTGNPVFDHLPTASAGRYYLIGEAGAVDRGVCWEITCTVRVVGDINTNIQAAEMINAASEQLFAVLTGDGITARPLNRGASRVLRSTDDSKSAILRMRYLVYENV
ncbi:MAG: hypothetical protein WCO98_05695 [bacterium]